MRAASAGPVGSRGPSASASVGVAAGPDGREDTAVAGPSPGAGAAVSRPVAHDVAVTATSTSAAIRDGLLIAPR